MKKINKYIKKINEYLPHIWTVVVTVVTLLDFDLSLLIAYFVYMGYSAYILLEEFVCNHRVSVNLQYKDWLEKRKFVKEREAE